MLLQAAQNIPRSPGAVQSCQTSRSTTILLAGMESLDAQHFWAAGHLRLQVVRIGLMDNQPISYLALPQVQGEWMLVDQ